MLKVLYLPLNDADSVQQGMYDAWANAGVKLEICDFYRGWLNTKNRGQVIQDFLNRVRDFQPHLIHMQLQFTGIIDSEALRQARQLCPNVIITNWSGDVRTIAVTEFTSVSNAIDYSLISSTGQLDMYKNSGCSNVKYWQIGYDPNFNYPMYKTSFKYDVTFIGNNYGHLFPDGPLRQQATQRLQSHYSNRFGLFGNGYNAGSGHLNPKQGNQVYNDSVCTLSISNFNNVSHYFSDRLLYCLASGRPTISWYFPGIESYFVEGSEILVARSHEDIIRHVDFCKANPEIATQIGINGYKRVIKEHTYTSRVFELIQMTNLTHLL